MAAGVGVMIDDNEFGEEDSFTTNDMATGEMSASSKKMDDEVYPQIRNNIQDSPATRTNL